MTRTDFHQLLHERGCLLADGATGTNYFLAGLTSGTPPEIWNDSQPEQVSLLHRQFIAAGADIILTNSFGGTANRLRMHGDAHRVGEVNFKAAALARQAVEETGARVLVAGSMGPTGDLYEPLGELTIEQAAIAYGDQARALAEGGADLMWIETLSSREELTAAVIGAATTGLPIVATMSFDTKGRTMMGISPKMFAELVEELPAPLSAIGANCGTGASELVCNILAMSGCRQDIAIVAKANCGLPVLNEAGQVEYSGTTGLMADYARLAREAGASIIGGCCGTTPEHVAAMREALDAERTHTRPSVEDIEQLLGPVSAYAKKTT